MFVFSSHTRPAHSETSTAALTTPALDRRSLRWFGISACTATPQDPPPSLAQHGSCRRSSTSSSLPFRTHVGAGNSAVVVDLPRCGPMLSPRVPNLVPIAGITGSAHCALRPLEGPRDHRVAPPTRCAAPTGRPTRAHRRRPELARSDYGRARATEPNRVADHPRHAVASAPAPHRRALDPTTSTAGPTVDLSRASPTRTAPRSRESDLGIPPHPRRTCRARPPPRCIHAHCGCRKPCRDRWPAAMGADAESSCTESRTDSWSPDGARNPWSAPTTELWAPTPTGHDESITHNGGWLREIARPVSRALGRAPCSKLQLRAGS